MTSVAAGSAPAVDHFQLIFDASPVGMALVGLDGGWIDVNASLCAMTGYERPDLLRRDFQSITHPDDLDADLEQLEALIAGRTTGYQMRKRYLRPSGGPVWVLLSVALVRDPCTSEPCYFVVQVVDLEAQRRAEVELENRERLFSLAFEASLVPMAVGDARGVLVEVNKAFCDLLGRDRSEMVGSDPDEFTHPDDRGVGGHHAQITDQDPSHEARYEKRYIHRDGQVIWAALTMTSVRSAEGEIRRLVHIEEIGAKRQRLLAQEAERVWLERLVQVQREITTLVTDREAVMERMIAGVLELMAQADGVAISLWADPRDHGAGLDCVAAGGVMAHLVGTHVTHDGSLTGITASGDSAVLSPDVSSDLRIDPKVRTQVGGGSTVLAPLLNGTETLGVLSVLSNQVEAFDERAVHLATVLAHSLAASLQLASDHERLAEAVEVATQRSQAIELASDAVIVRDLEDRIRYWSPSAERLFGWEAKQVLGNQVDDLLGTRTRDGQPLSAIRAELMQFGAWEGELEHQASDGRFVTVLTRKAVQRDRDGQPVAVLTINTDVTARRRAEEALQASEALFRSQFEHSAVGLAIRRADDLLESVNPALAAMLGYQHPNELIGTSARTHATDVGAEGRQAAMVEIYSGRADSVSYETALRRRDGSLVEVNFTSSVLRDRDGRPERFISIFEDISERRLAERARDAAIGELEEHNEQLAVADQLKTDLIGMLGHEINNPLSVLSGALDALTLTSQDRGDDANGEGSRDGKGTEEVTTAGWGLDPLALLPMMNRSVQRIGDTVREILAMVTADAGRLTARPQPVRIAAHLEDLLRALGTSIEVSGDLEVTASAQPEHLDQIATNLVSNATKYAGGLSGIRVTSEAGGVAVEFSDAGPGVSPRFREQLFERFTRAEETAEKARGTGLGLFICRELARANGGDLEHRPADPAGSVFVLRLPRVD